MTTFFTLYAPSTPSPPDMRIRCWREGSPNWYGNASSNDMYLKDEPQKLCYGDEEEKYYCNGSRRLNMFSLNGFIARK